MSKTRSWICLLLLLVCGFNVDAKQYKVSATAIFKNEGRFLREWIEYHRLIGVEHFYLYNNNSTDDYLHVLEPYIKEGTVELIDWSKNYTTTKEWTDIQCSAYADAIHRSRKKTKWLAIIDMDEFIVPVQNDKLDQVLKEYEEFGGVCVNWQLFGTSHVPFVKEQELMIEKLIYRAPSDYGENGFVKSIVRPNKVRYIADPHYVRYQHGYYQVNTNGIQTACGVSTPILTDKLRINHYWTKDEEFFQKVKIGRRETWTEGYANIMQRAENLNQVYDDAILRFVPRLRKRMGYD